MENRITELEETSRAIPSNSLQKYTIKAALTEGHPDCLKTSKGALLHSKERKKKGDQSASPDKRKHTSICLELKQKSFKKWRLLKAKVIHRCTLEEAFKWSPELLIVGLYPHKLYKPDKER